MNDNDRCPSVYLTKHKEERRCILPAGHQGKHYCPADAGSIHPYVWSEKHRPMTRRIGINLQDRTQQALREDGVLEVHSVFPTLQGEGPFAGRPAVFVRLVGCNLQCPLCDTDYTSKRAFMTSERLVNDVKDVMPPGGRLVVITGGEPFRQALGQFVREAIHEGFAVQIETNGTLYVDDMPWASDQLTVVCSPKTPAINPRLAERVTFFKYVLRHGEVDQQDGLPTRTLGNGTAVYKPWGSFPRDRVYVQPLDEDEAGRNARNAAACVQSAMQFGYTYSHQIHKLLNLE